MLVVCLHIGDFQVELDWPLLGCGGSTPHPIGWSHQHYSRAAQGDRAKIQHPIFPQHPHHVRETQPVDVEGPGLLDGIYVYHCH